MENLCFEQATLILSLSIIIFFNSTVAFNYYYLLGKCEIQNMNIIIPILSTLISSLIYVVLVYLGMNRKLEKILEREYEGKLNKAQALVILRLYLSEMLRELNREIDDFCSNRLNIILRDINNSSVQIRIQNSLERRHAKTQEIVSNKFSEFKLINGASFTTLSNHVNRDIIVEACKKMAEDISQFSQSLPTKEDINDAEMQSIKEILSLEMVKANKKGKRFFEEQLDIMYKK